MAKKRRKARTPTADDEAFLRDILADSEAIAQFRQTIGGDLKALAAAPQLAHVLRLEMAESGILTKHVKPLLASPYLSQLRSLDLSCNGLGDTAAVAVSFVSWIARTVRRLASMAATSRCSRPAVPCS